MRPLSLSNSLSFLSLSNSLSLPVVKERFQHLCGPKEEIPPGCAALLLVLGHWSRYLAPPLTVALAASIPPDCCWERRNPQTCRLQTGAGLVYTETEVIKAERHSTSTRPDEAPGRPQQNPPFQRSRLDEISAHGWRLEPQTSMFQPVRTGVSVLILSLR